MVLEDFDSLKINPEKASLGTLVRGIINAKMGKHICDGTMEHGKHYALITINGRSFPAKDLSEKYESKLNEFYQELDNREKSYNSYKEPMVCGSNSALRD